MTFFILVLLAIVAWAVYQYKVEKKARQARYNAVRKRTDESKPYNELSNPSWPRDVEMPINTHYQNGNGLYNGFAVGELACLSTTHTTGKSAILEHQMIEAAISKPSVKNTDSPSCTSGGNGYSDSCSSSSYGNGSSSSGGGSCD